MRIGARIETNDDRAQDAVYSANYERSFRPEGSAMRDQHSRSAVASSTSGDAVGLAVGGETMPFAGRPILILPYQHSRSRSRRYPTCIRGSVTSCQMKEPLTSSVEDATGVDSHVRASFHLPRLLY